MAISHIPRSIGHNFTPEYQISAVPYNTTTAATLPIVVAKSNGAVVDVPADTNNIAVKKIEFPKITQWIQFKSTTAVKVYFNRKDAANSGTSHQCIQLGANETTDLLYLRCTNLYFISTAASDLQIRAGLTTIDRSEFTEVVEVFLGDS